MLADLSLLLFFLFLLSLLLCFVLFHHFREISNIFISLRKKECQPLIFLLINEFPVWQRNIIYWNTVLAKYQKEWIIWEWNTLDNIFYYWVIPVSLLVFSHQSSHTFFLYPLLFLLLLPLSICVIIHHSFIKSTNFSNVITMVLSEVLTVC